MNRKTSTFLAEWRSFIAEWHVQGCNLYGAMQFEYTLLQHLPSPGDVNLRVSSEDPKLGFSHSIAP